MTAIQYISQLGAAASVATTDIIPVTQGSTGPGTGTTRKVTMEQAFGAPVPIGNTTPNTGKFTTLEVTNSSSTVRSFTAFVTKTLSGSAPGAVYRWGGGVSGTIDASLTGYYTTAMDSDTLKFSNTSNGMTLDYTGQTMSAGWSGGRTTQSTFLNVVGAGTAGDISGGSNAYHVSGSSFVEVAAKMGGNSNATRGNVFARNEGVTLLPGASYHINSVVGQEVDIGIQAGAEALYKVGHKLGLWKSDAVRGAIADYGYSQQATVNLVTATPGWRVGYALGGYEAWWPYTNSSTLMKKITTASSIAAGAPPYNLGQGIDFNGITFTESQFKGVGFRVDPSGNLGALTASGVALQTRSAVVARTAVVNTITVVEGGLYAGAITLTCSAPTTSGTTATATVATHSLPYMNNADTRGTGYVVGDTFTISGGTFTTAASGIITEVSSGQVFGVKITQPGNYSVLPAFPAATTTSGAGLGFTLTPMRSILTVNVSGAGTNYSEHLPPTITSSGATATFREAVFNVTMTATQAPLLLNAGSSTQVDSLTVNASGPTLRSGTGAATGTQPRGSMWMRTDGGVGTTLYVSQGGGTWNAVAGV